MCGCLFVRAIFICILLLILSLLIARNQQASPPTPTPTAETSWLIGIAIKCCCCNANEYLCRKAFNFASTDSAAYLPFHDLCAAKLILNWLCQVYNTAQFTCIFYIIINSPNNSNAACQFGLCYLHLASFKNASVTRDFIYLLFARVPATKLPPACCVELRKLINCQQYFPTPTSVPGKKPKNKNWSKKRPKQG